MLHFRSCYVNTGDFQFSQEHMNTLFIDSCTAKEQIFRSEIGNFEHRVGSCLLGLGFRNNHKISLS